jgi:hypothetical protein
MRCFPEKEKQLQYNILDIAFFITCLPGDRQKHAECVGSHNTVNCLISWSGIIINPFDILFLPCVR